MNRKVIEQHPYLLTLVLCMGVWAFTLCDEAAFSGTACMILSFLAIVQLFRKYRSPDRVQYGKFAVSSVGAVAAGILLFLVPYKGSVLLLGGIACLVLLYLKYKRKLLEADNLRLVILGFAVFLYICYILFSTWEDRSIDADKLHGGEGHLAYIEYLYDHWFRLPDFDPRTKLQLYHPPLYYWLSAAVVRITTAFGIPYDTAIESVQVISLYSAIATLLTADKIFRQCKLKGYALTGALAVTAFANSLVILSGCFNNDMLSIALETGAVYLALQWYDNRTGKNIVKIALCIGFGMMTKLSVVIAAPAIAFLFVYVFCRDIGKWKAYLGQFATFLGISVPLAVWFPVKNLVQFGVPLGYVPAGNYSAYMESIPVWQRLLYPDPLHFVYPITVTYGASVFGTAFPFEDYHPILALIKSSVTMQYMKELSSLAGILSLYFYITLLLGLIAFVGMVCLAFSKQNRVQNGFLLVLYASIMVSYCIFCIRYPNIYSENIRYVFDVIIIGALYLGLLLQKQIPQWLKMLLYALVIAYSILSVVLWVAVSFQP